MNAYIKKIVLFSQTGKMREVVLDEGLNIITGDSKTGKSALIEIVDYCLFASRSTIPVGRITDFSELFCIVLKVSEKFLVIARPCWGSSDRGKAYFSFETDGLFLDTFALTYFSNKSLRALKDVQQDVEQHLGLSVLDTRESGDDSKQGAGKVTMRSFVSLLFQHQNLIANKHSLFYRFDDYQKRQKTIDQLPILLGWVDAQYYSLKQQLAAKQKQLSIEQRRLKTSELSKTELTERLRRPIEQYFTAIGYVLDENISFNELKKIAQKLPDVPKTAEEDSNLKAQLAKLKNQKTGYRNELAEITSLIEQIQNNNAEAYSYSNVIGQIVSTHEFEEHQDNIKCPVCGQQARDIEDVIKTIKDSRNDLVAELQHLGRYHSDSTEHLSQLIEKQDQNKRYIRAVSAEITNLEAVDRNKIQNQSLRETLMLLRGRIEVSLEHILNKTTLSQSPFDMDELRNEIAQIEDTIAGYDLDAKIEDANSFIDKRMTEISEQLDFEKELQPGQMRFDLKVFDFYYVHNKQKIRLSEMGSGANWLACHLSLFLSILHLSCKEKDSCIPSFLFIDQPSQVYFPKVTNIISKNKQSETEENDDEHNFDENIKQVKNIFNVILKEIAAIKDDCGFLPQVVVMEHADEEEFYGYVKKRWDSRGEKLI